MTLLEELIKKLPECAGWPKDADRCIYHEHKEGATFYDAEGDMVKNGLGFIDLCIPDVRREEVTREQYESALGGSKPEWDGEGLPPVGCNVEALFEGEWVEVTVAYCDCPKPQWDASVWSEALVFNRITTRPFWADEFRPIRSEEEKKRDEAAKGLVEYLDKETDIDNVFSIKDVIGFYDAIAAGKIPHIRID